MFLDAVAVKNKLSSEWNSKILLQLYLTLAIRSNMSTPKSMSGPTQLLPI